MNDPVDKYPHINFQPELKNEMVIAKPLSESDFDELFAAASDPLIWAQHPNRNRYQLEHFTNYFKGAIQSGGAFIFRDAVSGEVIGSSRYSDYVADNSMVSIGYTFFIRSHWGTGHNHAAKKLMVDYIFNHIETVRFYIGAKNKRSQVSIERLGGKKIGEEEVAYFGEDSQLNFVYAIEKNDWLTRALQA